MSEPDQSPEPTGPSFPYGGMIVIFIILIAIAHGGRASWWGIVPHLVAIGLIGWGGYEAASRKTYEHIRKQYPGETRLNWVLNNVLCFVVFPGLVWLIFGVPSLVEWLKH